MTKGFTTPSFDDDKGSDSAKNAAAGKKHFNCMMTPAMHRKFKQKAAAEDSTMSEITLALIQKYLDDEITL